ncbi:uncharacterized protein LOC119599738 [Lucilia sericata]|uniref:uncharacterized protein LOC119599738 n=1 Tax=Lucilia sericata TaxID=13632 RepID=UPI0018A878B4|nr:uncharacterized protein LOC119599738 [Lucilia sericata]
MPRPKNSVLRSYFEITRDNQAICRNDNCDNRLLNTHAGNLERHLKKIHPVIFESYVKRKGRRGGALITNFKSEVLSTSPSPSDVLTTTTTSFEREATPKLSSAVNKEHIQMALVELFTKCGRPLSMAEDPPFKMLVTPILEALDMKLNERSVMKNITQYSINLKNEIMEELRGRLISLKIDAATMNSISVLGVNVQYIKDNSVVIKTIAIKQLTQQLTSEYLKNIILEVLNSYEINLNQVVTITTDNGADMVKADNDLNDDISSSSSDEVCMDYDLPMDNITNVRCGTHILQLCAAEVMKSTDIKQKLDSIRALIRKLRTQKYINSIKCGDYKMPSLDNVAKWSSTYLMLEHFVALKVFIDDNLDISDDIWTFADEFIKVFQVIYTATKKLQSENLIYSDLYIEITNITIQLDNLPHSDLKLYLTESLNRQKNKLLENNLFVTAIYLDPRIKVCLTSNQRESAKSCIMQLQNRLLNLNDYDDCVTMESVETEESPTNSPLTVSNAVDDELEEYFKSFEKASNMDISTTSHSIEQDILIYENQNRLGIKENIIDYWSKQKNALSEIAYVVLAIPCTQVSVERLFSALKYMLSDQRNKPSSTNLEHILLVRANGHFIYD